MAIAAVDDTSGGINDSLESITVAHTVAGSDRILIVSIQNWSNAGQITCTSVKWNGADLAMAIHEDITGNTGEIGELWYLVAPATGTANIVVDATGLGSTSSMSVGVISFTGVKQTGQPDAVDGGSDSGTSGGSAELTTIADNCFVVSNTQAHNSDGIAEGGGVTEYFQGASTWQSHVYSTAKTPAGLVTHTWTNGGGSEVWVWTALSIAPVGGTAHTQALTDRLVLIDNAARSTQRALSDRLILIGNIRKSASRALADRLILLDAARKSTQRALSDRLVLLSAISKTTSRALRDPLLLIDRISRSITRTLSDRLILADAISALKAIFVNLVDRLILSDTARRSTSRSLADRILLIDSSSKTTQRLLADAIVLTDSIGRTIGKLITETLVLRDAITRSITRTLTDALALIDSFTGGVAGEIIRSIGRFVVYSRTGLLRIIYETKRSFTIYEKGRSFPIEP